MLTWPQPAGRARAATVTWGEAQTRGFLTEPQAQRGTRQKWKRRRRSRLEGQGLVLFKKHSIENALSPNSTGRVEGRKVGHKKGIIHEMWHHVSDKRPETVLAEWTSPERGQYGRASLSLE